jgi:outer membrane protein OmpA-like peptidoglycan-associated protein
MKINTFICTGILAILSIFDVQGMKQPAAGDPSNYVVIGAFASHNNAIHFIEKAKKLNFSAESDINPTRQLYYVYVLHTPNKGQAFREANKIRKASPFADTWVFSGKLGATSSPGKDADPSNGKAIEKVVSKDEVTTPAEVIPTAVNPVISEVTESTPEKSVAPVADAPEGSKNFFFRIFSSVDQKELGGDVDEIDNERSKKVATFKGNQTVAVKAVNKTGHVSFVCEVFGYRKSQKDLDFNQPQQTEGAVEENNQVVLPFELIRLQKGDVSVMYNVYFFRDAAIMRPESRYEVDNLLSMMNENPKYKIKIHGHTNGNAAGKVITMGDSKNFFSLTGTKEGFGSAKKLSEQRAKVIREYLITQGIDEKRMEVKAWGGKRPIRDKNSANAAENVRVEVEILDDK